MSRTATSNDSGGLLVSVVIATRNREARLAFALEALAAQSLALDEFEVIVVRATDPAIPRATTPPGLRVRWIEWEEPPNSAAQRNAGWRLAEGELIAFTDDDCRPTATWLAELVAAQDGEAFVQGRTLPDPDEAHLLWGLARSQEIVGPSDWYQTCNIAYPRRVLEQLDGFDAGFGELGEDTDLGLRAREAGFERRYADAALAYHAVIVRTLRGAVREGWRRSPTVPRLFRRHPEQRERIQSRFFWKRSHQQLTAVLVVAAVTRHPALTAAAAVPYVLDHFNPDQHRGLRGALRVAVHLPAQTLADGAELAGTARGALRARILVL